MEARALRHPVLRSTLAKRAPLCARIALAGSAATVLLLASLHVLSPEFDPSWRMISEYAYGHFGGVLSAMFLALGVSSGAAALAIQPLIRTRSGKIGMSFLLLAGVGGAMASVFDITHDVGHGIAGLLGMGGFPLGAVLVSSNLGRLESWQRVRGALSILAHMSWITVVLLIGSLVLMSIQFMHVNGGELPTQAPTVLPDGVLGLDGWANRLNVLVTCAWVFIVGLTAGDTLRSDVRQWIVRPTESKSDALDLEPRSSF